MCEVNARQAGTSRSQDVKKGSLGVGRRWTFLIECGESGLVILNPNPCAMGCFKKLPRDSKLVSRESVLMKGFLPPLLQICY